MDKICPNCTDGKIYTICKECGGRGCKDCQEVGEWLEDCKTCKGTGKIPIYETPEQYKNRTGKDWPDDAPVWCGLKMRQIDHTNITHWILTEFGSAKSVKDRYFIISNEAGKPPADYRPGREEK